MNENPAKYEDLGFHALLKLERILDREIGNPLDKIQPSSVSDPSVSHALAAEMGKLQILRQVRAAIARSTPA